MTERQRGIQIHRPIIYGNSAYPLTQAERDASPSPDHTHRWTVAIRSAASPPNDRADQIGGADDLSHFIKRVTFRLHETYPQQNRNIDKPPFEVTETGWGEFDINIRVTFVAESGEKTLSFMHHLKLHPWAMPDVVANPTADPATLYAPPPTSSSTPGDPNAPTSSQPLLEPVYSWQYDEIVFTDPPKAFLDILLANPPTPLPKIKKRPTPSNPAHVPSLGPQPTPGTPTRGGGGNIPEFTQVLERDEAERLDAAKRAVVDATDAQRALLIEKEREIEKLRRGLEA